jgi:peptide-methionine (R)-S-oxide reductase
VDDTQQSRSRDPRDQSLTEAQRFVCGGGTERPFTGEYWDCTDNGTYRCVRCQSKLFQSEAKYDSGTGWPSFYDIASPSALKKVVDSSHGMARVEVRCNACDSHLGHVFEDGPEPTGLRYCINSAAISLKRSN